MIELSTMSGMLSRSKIAHALSKVETLPEIARMMGLSPEALYRLEKRYADFPEPIMLYGKTRVYVISEVIDFHMSVGRIYGRGKALARSRA